MRTYERTHPWLKFEADLAPLGPDGWMLLGEAQSKCEHIAGVPLRPGTAEELNRLFLAKGVLATTAIEGNTLSEDQVRAHIEGKLKLPLSKAYLQREIDNILKACNAAWVDVIYNRVWNLTVDRICMLNAQVLDGLEVDEDVVPGAIRKHVVGVSRYRGAPPEDCQHLLERLCDWLNGPSFRFDASRPDHAIVNAVIKAILAHLYLAWIHPFGDGNGRTARLVELEILVHAGVPMPSAHLLSNFYNETRAEYYRQLDRASKSGGDIIPFLNYAIRGFVDGLRGQVELIRAQQWDVTWRNYVHEHFRIRNTDAEIRQKHLILDLSSKPEPVPRAELPRVSPRVAEAYAKKGTRTLSRDINALLKANLLIRAGKGFAANRSIILAFLPTRAPIVSELEEEEGDGDDGSGER